MSKSTIGRELFFRYFAWILFLIVVACFGGKALFDTKDLPPITYYHHIHALAMMSWFVLFAVQPTLIHLGKVRLHRLLGKFSPIIVLTFLCFAAVISQLNWHRQGDPLIITANTVNLILFVGLYISAIVWRRNVMAHRRLMLYATISLMGPAFGRIPEIFDQSVFLSVPLMLATQIAPIVHDIIVHRRVHPATWVGFALVFATIPIILGLSGSPAWAAFLESVLGTPNLGVAQ